MARPSRILVSSMQNQKCSFIGEDGLFNHPKIISHLERQRVRKDAIQSRLNIPYSNPMRLPSTLVANHYDVHLKPYYPAPGISYDSGKFDNLPKVWLREFSS